MKKEQSGVDTTSLQQKVAELKKEVCTRKENFYNKSRFWDPSFVISWYFYPLVF